MIVSLDRIEQIDQAIRLKILDKTKYACLIAENGEYTDIVIQPTVTTKGRNTYIILRQPQSSVEKCREIFGDVMTVKSITFRDDNFTL